MFIGMGAGKDEDINSNPRNTHRQPWCGRAGKYLRIVIKHLWDDGLEFNIALSNTVRCHPKDSKGKDRAPTTQEEKWCASLLTRDIESVRPKVLVPCGLSASKCIGNYPEDVTMGKIHGKVVSHNGLTIISTYHASYLTRQYGTFKAQERNSFDLKVIADIRKAVELAKGM